MRRGRLGWQQTHPELADEARALVLSGRSAQEVWQDLSLKDRVSFSRFEKNVAQWRREADARRVETDTGYKPVPQEAPGPGSAAACSSSQRVLDLATRTMEVALRARGPRTKLTSLASALKALLDLQRLVAIDLKVEERAQALHEQKLADLRQKQEQQLKDVAPQMGLTAEQAERLRREVLGLVY